MESAGEYHGIVIDLSQKMRSVFGELEIIGRRRFFFNTMSLLKLRVSADALEPAIAKLQANLRRGLGPFVKAFYFHFYREGELIVVFKICSSTENPSVSRSISSISSPAASRTRSTDSFSDQPIAPSSTSARAFSDFSQVIL
jgi:hypothetical protein